MIPKRIGKARSAVLEQLTTLVTAAFGLVAALAWNDAISTIFATYIDKPGNSVVAAVTYALSVTIIAVLVTLWLGKKSGE